MRAARVRAFRGYVQVCTTDCRAVCAYISHSFKGSLPDLAHFSRILYSHDSRHMRAAAFHYPPVSLGLGSQPMHGGGTMEA